MSSVVYFLGIAYIIASYVLLGLLMVVGITEHGVDKEDLMSLEFWFVVLCVIGAPAGLPLLLIYQFYKE